MKHSMNTKQVQGLSFDILAGIAAELNGAMDADVTMGREPFLGANDIREALDDTLARHFPAGGVLLVWWDADEGLRMNPAPLPVDSAGRVDATSSPAGKVVD